MCLEDHHYVLQEETKRGNSLCKKASLALKVLVICCEFLCIAWKNASMYSGLGCCLGCGVLIRGAE